MIRLNYQKFIELQGEMTEGEMAEKIGVSRTQLWRIKTKSSAVGEAFISKFKKAFPNESIDEYFFVENVELNQQCNMEGQLSGARSIDIVEDQK